eukprot:gene8537-biopygen9575
MQELELLVTRVKLASEDKGLMLNTQKTKVTKMAGDPENLEMKDLIMNGEVIETVENFIYQTSQTTAMTARRLEEDWQSQEMQSSAWATFGKTAPSRSITKTQILNTLVFPVATYGCEC